MDYGKTWLEHRKLIHIALNSEAIKKYYSVQEQMTSLLLVGLLKDPQNFDALFRL
jgi:cytochrome P450